MALDEISRITHQIEDIIVEQNQRSEGMFSSYTVDLLYKYHFALSKGIEKKKKDLNFEPDLQVIIEKISAVKMNVEA